ncbi:fasciclin domain-containing protein [Salinimicrobium sp. GXAS 041]|uniref:fasciclin domain-containing protein n=1 Tax=Salinimicrobium sp. GXAS 041 TaxID=3400806 RepID=UPI003C774F4D
MKNLKYVFTFCFAIFVLTSCQDKNSKNEMVEEEGGVRMDEIETNEVEDNVYQRLSEEEDLREFSAGMTRAGLSDDFSEGEGPFTIFAPANVAFDGLAEAEKGEYQDSDNVRANLARMYYLVVERELPAAELRQAINDVGGDMELITMQGERLIASIEGEKIVLKDGLGNTATITQPDRNASNGVVHIIDGILRPQDLDRIDFSEETLDTVQ